MPTLQDLLSRLVPMFMDGGEPTGGPAPTPQPAPQPAPSPAPAPAGKTFTEEYVQALRQEAAGHRTHGKTLEQALRTGLGLKEGDALPADIPAAIAAIKTAGTAEAETVKTQAKGALLKAHFLTAAAGKVADVEDAYILAGSLLTGIEVDLATGALTIPQKDGKARTLADIVTDLLTAKPHLKAGGSQGAGVGGTATCGGSGGQKPTAQEIAQNLVKQHTPEPPKKSLWG